jgi:hypothetical protein
MKKALASWLALLIPASALLAQVPAPVSITVAPATPATPPVSFTLGPRHGHVTPTRSGRTHTGGGNIDVAQPSPDTLLITMTAAAVAYGSACDASAAQNCDLEQAFEINFDNPKLKNAKLTMEGRVIGLLRTHGKNDTASYDNACASVVIGPTPLVSLCVPSHAAVGGQNLAVNDHAGPLSVPIVPGKYCLRQTFVVSVLAHKCLVGKGPSAEFAPEPAIDPLWISCREPFHGAIKKDFGFQILLKVAEDTEPTDSSKKEAEPLPPPHEK